MSIPLSIIPIRRDGRVLLVVILGPGALARLKVSDPADINLEILEPIIGSAVHQHIHDLDIMLCYEEDHDKLAQLIFDNSTLDKSGAAIMEYLKRGYTITAADQTDRVVNMTDLMRKAAEGPAN